MNKELISWEYQVEVSKITQVVVQQRRSKPYLYQGEMALYITNHKDPYDSVMVYPIACSFNSIFCSLQTKWIWKMIGCYTNSTKVKSYWKLFYQSIWIRICGIQSFTFSFPMRKNNQKQFKIIWDRQQYIIIFLHQNYINSLTFEGI